MNAALRPRDMPNQTVQICRHMDATAINAVLNHPDVRPWVVAKPTEAPIDISAEVSNSENVLLMGDHGGAMFFKVFPGTYELHTQVLPEGRGDWTLAMGRAAARYMYTKTDAVEITTRVPRGHLAARAAALAMGFRLEFTRPMECWFRGKLVDVDIYTQRIQDWITTAEGMEVRGAWFHDRLAEEAARLKITTPPHGEDANHDRYVGAALEMALAGHPLKAVSFYNRWAVLVRHPIIQAVKGRSLLIRFDIGLLRINHGGVEIIQE